MGKTTGGSTDSLTSEIVQKELERRKLVSEHSELVFSLSRQITKLLYAIKDGLDITGPESYVVGDHVVTFRKSSRRSISFEITELVK